MKKLKKNQLKLDKEVISSLSESDLFAVKGGEIGSGECIPIPVVSIKPCMWRTRDVECKTAVLTQCNDCDFTPQTQQRPFCLVTKYSDASICGEQCIP